MADGDEPGPPYPLLHEQVLVTGTSPADALRRAADVAERVLASDEHIALDDVSFEPEDDAVVLSFYVPTPFDDERRLTRAHLAELLAPETSSELVSGTG